MLKFRTNTMIDAIKYENADFNDRNIYKRKSFNNDVIIKYADKVNPYYSIKYYKDISEEQLIQIIPRIFNITQKVHLERYFNILFYNITNNVFDKLIEYYINSDVKHRFHYYIIENFFRDYIYKTDKTIYLSLMKKYKNFNQVFRYENFCDDVPLDFFKDYFYDIIHNKFCIIQDYDYKFSIKTFDENLDKLFEDENNFIIILDLLNNNYIQENIQQYYNSENKDVAIHFINHLKQLLIKHKQSVLENLGCYLNELNIFILRKCYDSCKPLFENEDYIHFCKCNV